MVRCCSNKNDDDGNDDDVIMGIGRDVDDNKDALEEFLFNTILFRDIYMMGSAKATCGVMRKIFRVEHFSF